MSTFFSKLLGKDEGVEKYYHFGEVLGQGSFAKVYKAKSKNNGAFVAIKCINKSGSTNMEMMEAEVQILNHVHHPNCASILEIFDTEHTLYLVMDLCCGGELLKSLAKRERFSEREASLIIKDVLEGLQYLHAQGIVHRDLKPENLLLADKTPDSLIKITDFGLSKLVQGKHQFLFSRCGTPAYVAPELIVGQPYTAKVDLWSVGVITFLIIAGYPPFYGDSLEKLFDAIVLADYSFHPQYWHHVSPSCIDFIRSLLQKNPEHRLDATQALSHTWILNAPPKATSLRSMAGIRSYTQARGAAAYEQLMTTSTSTGADGASDALHPSGSFSSSSSEEQAVDPWRFFTEAIAETREAAGRSLESSDMRHASTDGVSTTTGKVSRVFVYDIDFDPALFPRVEAKYPRWPHYDVALKAGRLTGNFDIGVIAAAMARSSPQKDRAFEAGFIRPFLLLVSMSPYTRLAAAASLGLEGMQEKIWYGNPHLEAWEILSTPKLGLIDRTAKFKDRAFADLLGSICWFDTLFRVTDKVFTHRKDPDDIKDKIADYQHYIATISRSSIQQACRDPTQSQLIEELETTFVVEMIEKIMRYRATVGRGALSVPNVFDSFEQLKNASAMSRRIVENFEIAGLNPERSDDLKAMMIFANFFFGHRWLRDGVDEGTNESFFQKEKQEGLRSFMKRQMGYGWLLSICALMTMQRILIAAVGVPLGPFYPDPRKML